MRRSLSLAALVAACLVPIAASPAAAFPLTTCTLALESTDGTGAPLDTATAGSPDSTVSDPFKVDWDGTVGYTGSTTVVIKNYSYQVSVFGIPTPIRGSDANDDENTDGDGSVSVGANAPFRVAGLYYVSGGYKGEGGECAGSGWFQLVGSPIGTVPWIVAIVLTILGMLALYVGSRGRLVMSVVGGVVLGLGLAMLLISHSVMPLAENTPLAALVGGIILGVLIGAAGRRGRSAAEVPPAA